MPGSDQQETLKALLALYQYNYVRANIPEIIADGVTSLDIRRLGKPYLAMLIGTTKAKLERQ